MLSCRRLLAVLLALALLSACAGSPPQDAPTLTPVAAPTAAAALPQAGTPAPTLEPAATAVPTATPGLGPTPTPPLPTALIDAASASRLAPVRGLGFGDALSAAFTPDGAALVVGTTAGLVWYGLPGLAQRRFDPVGAVFNLAIAPGGDLLAYGMLIADDPERSAIRRAGAADLVAEVMGGRPRFSDDGALLATDSSPYGGAQAAWVWRADDGAPVAELLGAEPRFSPGGSYVVTVEAHFDRPSITRVYPAAGGAPLLELEATRPAFSPDGAALAVTGGAGVEVYALPGGALQTSIPTPSEGAASFDAAGRLLIVVGDALWVWDLATNSELQRFAGVNRAEEVFLPGEPLFGPEGASVASFEPPLGDCPPSGLQVNSADDGRVLYTDDAAYSAAFSPAGDRVAALTGNGLRVIDLGAGDAVDLALSAYEAFAFSFDGATLAAASGGVEAGGRSEMRIELWDIVTWAPITTLRTAPDDFAYGLSQLSFSPDGARVSALVSYGCAAFGQWKVVAWEVASGQVVSEIGDLPNTVEQSGEPVNRLPEPFAIAPGGAAAAWADEQGQVVVRLPSGEERPLDLADTPTALAFTPDGSQLLVALPTGELRYAPIDGTPSMPGGMIGGVARELSISPAGSRIVAVLEQGAQILVASDDMGALADLGVAEGATGASLSADGAVAAIGEPDGAALFDAVSGARIGGVDGGAGGALLGPGRRLLGTLDDGRVVLWGAP